MPDNMVSRMFTRCQRSLEAEDTALTSSLNDVITKCPGEPSNDYIRARYLACEYAVPCRRHSPAHNYDHAHRHDSTHRPSSLCQSQEDYKTAALDVVTSHTASRYHSNTDDDVSNDVGTSQCRCGRRSLVTQFGTFSSLQLPLATSTAPPT